MVARAYGRAFDHSLVGDRGNGDCLLHEAMEKLAPVPEQAAI